MDIKTLRLQTGLSQKEFANKYNIPVKTLQHWEAGESSPAPYLLDLIAKTIPLQKESRRMIESDYSVFYYDCNENAVYDREGNKIYLRIDIEHVKEHNLVLYLESLFDNYYKAQKQFEFECNTDAEEDIIWEKLQEEER